MGGQRTERHVRQALFLVGTFLLMAVALVGCDNLGNPGGPSNAVAHKHVVGEDCATCHSKEHRVWALSLHAASASDALLNVEHNKAEVLTNECVHCMSPFQEKVTIGALVTPLNTKGPWKLLPAASKWQSIGCEVCHDPTSKAPVMLAFYNGTTGAYEPVADATALCEKCHQPGTDDSRDLKGSVHEGIGCVGCHLRRGMAIDPRGSCGSCHPSVDVGKHPDVTTLDTTYRDVNSKNNIHFVTCKTCHPKGIPPIKK